MGIILILFALLYDMKTVAVAIMLVISGIAMLAPNTEEQRKKGKSSTTAIIMALVAIILLLFLIF